jgi:hypothetical protein
VGRVARAAAQPPSTTTSAKRLAHFHAQGSTLANELERREGDEGKRIADHLGEIDRKIERQFAAIEAGVDPVLVGDRIRDLKAERKAAQAVLSQLEDERRDSAAVDPEDAAAILVALPTWARLSAPPIPSCAARSSTPSGCGSRSTATRAAT